MKSKIVKKFTAIWIIFAMIVPMFTSCSNSKNWRLSAPVYSYGDVSAEAYNIGAGIDCDAEAVGGKMMVISDTDEKDFNKYLKKLRKNDYTEISKNEINGNTYIQYKKGENLLYVYFLKAFNEVRVIEDYVSVPETEIEYSYTPKDGETTTIYQYALMTDPTGNGSGENCEGKWFNNGMFYVIRLADNSLILVDGGSGVQVSEKGTEELVDFFYDITNTPENEKLRISAVIITHAHEDHKKYVENLVAYHSDKIVVERAIYNIPSFSILGGYSGGFDELGRMLAEKFPDIKFMKPHTGQKIQLADIQMEIVFTHEDMVHAKTGTQQITNFNNTSTIFKFTINGKTFMMLGDTGGGDLPPEEYPIYEERLLGMYRSSSSSKYDITPTCEFLESDIVQVAHHAINYYMGNIYNAIKAQYALFTQADCKYNQFYHGCYGMVIDQIIAAGVTKMYFMGRTTCGITISQDGSMTFEQIPIAGASDDYESYLGNFDPYYRAKE